MKEILQRLEDGLCKIATSELSIISFVPLTIVIQWTYTALKFCYIHPDGVENQTFLQLRICDDSEKGKELFIERGKTEESLKVCMYKTHYRLLYAILHNLAEDFI